LAPPWLGLYLLLRLVVGRGRLGRLLHLLPWLVVGCLGLVQRLHVLPWLVARHLWLGRLLHREAGWPHCNWLLGEAAPWRGGRVGLPWQQGRFACLLNLGRLVHPLQRQGCGLLVPKWQLGLLLRLVVHRQLLRLLANRLWLGLDGPSRLLQL